MAKSLAGRGARLTAKHCQQVLAGIGFTTEHDLHRYVRRVLVLDELFGSARALTKDLGEQLLATSQLPPLLPHTTRPPRAPSPQNCRTPRRRAAERPRSPATRARNPRNNPKKGRRLTQDRENHRLKTRQQ